MDILALLVAAIVLVWICGIALAGYLSVFSDILVDAERRGPALRAWLCRWGWYRQWLGRVAPIELEAYERCRFERVLATVSVPDLQRTADGPGLAELPQTPSASTPPSPRVVGFARGIAEPAST